MGDIVYLPFTQTHLQRSRKNKHEKKTGRTNVKTNTMWQGEQKLKYDYYN